MSSKRPTNPIQIEILRQLARGHTLRFSEINKTGHSSDQFAYHLRELLKNSLVSKTDDGLYRLTERGSGLTLELDKNMKQYVERGIIGTLAIITKYEGSKEFILLQRRSRHPNRGKFVLPGGQILFGEQIDDAIQRVINIETGLTGVYKLLGMRHLLTQEPGEPAQDLYFFIYKAEPITEAPEKDGPNGENVWVPIDSLDAHNGNPFLKEIIAMRTDREFSIEEYRQVTANKH